MGQLFYATRIEGGFAFFDEEESRHLLTVLRRKIGDRMSLTDGKGNFYETELAEIGKKHATARIISQQPAPPESQSRLHIAIAPTKQMERLEWFLEKSTEIGIAEITLLHCKRSERDTVRLDRLEKITVSAMKQSLRAFLPVLNELTPFAKLVKNSTAEQKFIAWCGEELVPHLKNVLDSSKNTLVLIGPEGDFTPEEVRLALDHGFRSVNLGAARLRTETAGVMVAAIAAITS